MRGNAVNSLEDIGTSSLGLSAGLASPDSDSSALGGELHGYIEN